MLVVRGGENRKRSANMPWDTQPKQASKQLLNKKVEKHLEKEKQDYGNVF